MTQHEAIAEDGPLEGVNGLMVEAENDAWPEFVDWQGPERGTWQRYRYTTVSVGREGLPSYKHERTLEPGEGPKGS